MSGTAGAACDPLKAIQTLAARQHTSESLHRASPLTDKTANAPVISAGNQAGENHGEMSTNGRIVDINSNYFHLYMN
jgi:hypothetical protein